MKSRLLVALVFSALLTSMFLTGCNAQKAASQAKEGDAPEKGGKAQSTTAVDGWQKQWEDLKKAAEKEGEVAVIFESSVPAAMIQVIREKWAASGNKITLYASSMSGPEMGEKIPMERNANQYNVDLVFTGQNTLSNKLKKSNALEPIDEKVLILPEVAESKYWYDNTLHYSDKEKMILNTVSQASAAVWINTKEIKPDEIKSYQDLLNPKYKGKIVMGDVRLAGSPQRWLSAMMLTKTFDEAYLAKLKEQIAVISPSPDLVAQWIAQNKYPIGLAVTQTKIETMQNEGAPVAPILVEAGAYSGGGPLCLGFFNKAPHPNAAKFFINWYLTKDVQIAVTPPSRYQSARVDVPTTGLSPNSLRREGVKYFDTGTEDFSSKQPGIAKIAVQIFGAPGVK